MEPALTWIDLTSRDREKMRRVLDLLSEQGTIDEMGLGTIRDAFADTLFPGTSSIQTRLRYVLFVPWIYRALEAKRVSAADIAVAARNAELALIPHLKESGEKKGIIGARAGTSLARLPSHVYWSALVRWGIFQPGRSQGWYQAHFERFMRGGRSAARADDPGVIFSVESTWHPRLPSSTKGFPANASFELQPEESDFLRGRVEEACGGTLLAWLARAGSTTPAEHFWDDPVVQGASKQIREQVELAARFSLHVEGLPLLYNLLLAEHRYAGASRQEGDDELIDWYRGALAEWAALEQVQPHFSPDSLWAFMLRAKVNPAQRLRRFIEAWSKRVSAIGPAAVAGDRDLEDLVRVRERQLKGKRARFENPGRLLDWGGEVGVGRMDFRWFRVRQLLIDLHQGLAA